MIRTSQEIMSVLYAAVKSSGWVTGSDGISGGVYFDGLRPRDSGKEDAVLIHTAGLTGQVQTGTVTVLVYFPDLRPFGNGVNAPDLSRMDVVGKAVQQWISSLAPITGTGGDVQFHQNGAPIVSGYDGECGQHYLSVRINYRTITL